MPGISLFAVRSENLQCRMRALPPGSQPPTVPSFHSLWNPKKTMSSRKFGLNLVVVLAIAALFTGFWALINRPVNAPNWPEQISGFSYSPFQQGQYPQKDQYPTDDEMRRDLEIMSKLTDNIRTYSVDGTLQDIPRLAEEHTSELQSHHDLVCRL